MNLSSQVPSLELSRRLKELNVKQDSLFRYTVWSGKKVTLKFSRNINTSPAEYAAYTTGELGEMLPKNENIVTMHFPNGHAQIAIQGDVELEEGLATRWGAASKCIEADNEANARAKLLIYLIENDLIPKTNAAVFGGKEI